MKKFISVFMAAFMLVLLFCANISAAEVKYNLIDENLTWKDEKYLDSDTSTEYAVKKEWKDGKLSLSTEKGWPSTYAEFDEPIKVKGDAKINIDFTLISGHTNIHLALADGTQVSLHRSLGLEVNEQNYDSGSNDLIKAGQYTATITLKDAICRNDSSIDEFPMPEPDEDGYYTISKVKIFTVLGGLEINKLELVAEEADIPDESSKPDTPATGDASMIYAALAIISICGAVAVNVYRRKAD